MVYKITGGNKLRGKVNISGNKNSIFPCLAAALLTDEEVILENIPNIRDTEVMIQILEKIGVSVKREDHNLKLKVANLKHQLPDDLVGQLRGSIVLAGAILSRLGKVSLHHPGGDIIGRRGVEVHWSGFEKLGAEVITNDLSYEIKFKKSRSRNPVIFQLVPSVTGTENQILASVLHPGLVTIKNC